MIICLSGFVIAGSSASAPAPAAARADLAAPPADGPAPARYSPHHQQLLTQFPLAHAHALRGAGGRSSSSSAESVSPPAGAGAGAGAGAARVRTLYACLGESAGELSFEPNQIITNVAPSGEPGWLRGELRGRRGLVPENYVEPLP